MAIEPIGDFFAKDEAGYLINPTKAELIPSALIPLLEAVLSTYHQLLDSSLIHSIYLRGSVARGTYVEGISDLDTLALVHSPGIRWAKLPGAVPAIERLQNQYHFPGDLELMLTSLTIPLVEYHPRLAFVLQSQSLCIAGTSIIPDLPKYRVSEVPRLALDWLVEDWTAFQKQQSPGPADCRRMAKLCIRAAFEWVVPRLGRYTLDLYPAVESVIEFYPERASQLRTLLAYYIIPPQPLSAFQQLIENNVRWLLAELA